MCSPSRARVRALFLLACFFASLLSFSEILGEETDLLGSVRVLHFGPTGIVDSLDAISIVFDQPMVSNAETGARSRSGPLEIEPEVAGRFEWIGSSALLFVPDAPVPPGTKLTCRVPEGTRSKRGTALARAVRWEIAVSPPQWVASWPPAKSSVEETSRPSLKKSIEARPLIFDPWRHPIVLRFDRAADPQAWRLFRLSGTEGEIALVPAAVDSSLRAILASQNGSADETTPPDADFIAVRPASPLRPGEQYKLVVPDDLPFPNGRLGLAEPIVLEISTPAEPRILGARASEQGIFLDPTNPFDPDSLRARIEISPDPGDVTVRARWRDPIGPLAAEGTNAIWIAGSFPPGESFEVRIESGVRDIFGLAAQRPFVFRVEIPHREPRLSLSPSDGALLAGGSEFVRLSARNVGPVRVRAAWIRSGDVPLAYSETAERRLAGDATAEVPWQQTWDVDRIWDPGIADDSLHVFDVRFADVPLPPRDLQMLWIEAIADPILGDRGADSLRCAARVQFGTVGLTCAMGYEHGLLWATDLESGQPLSRAEVALHRTVEPEEGPGPLASIWSGRTDENGLAWIPGAAQLDSLDATLARVELPGRRGWLPIPDGTALGSGDPDVRAAVIVDKTEVRPGDRLQWRAWVRTIEKSGPTLPGVNRVTVSFEGAGWKAQQKRPLDLAGNAHGTYSVPSSAPDGPLRIAVRHPDTGATLGDLELRVHAHGRLALETSLSTSRHRVLAGDEVLLQASVTRRGGTPLGPMPLAWDLSLEPLEWAPRGWESFSFRDPWLEERTPLSHEPAPQKLDPDGLAQWRLSTRPRDRRSDSRVHVRVRPGDLHDPALTAECVVDVLSPGPRVGVRPIQDRPEHRGAAAWEWVVIDTSGAVVAGAEVTAVVARSNDTGSGSPEDPKAAWIEVYRRSLVSATEPQTLAFAKPVPGRYALRLQVTSGSTAGALSAEGIESPSGGLPFAIELDEDAVVLPQTPSSGAQTLLVLHDRDLIRARSTFVRGFPNVSMPRTGLLPPSVGITAVQVGSLPKTTGSELRRKLPSFSMATIEAPVSDASIRPKIELRPLATEGDTVSVEISVRSSSGLPIGGEIAFAIYDAEESDPVGEWLDPLRGLLDGHSRAIRWADTRSQLALSGSDPVAEFALGDGAPVPAASIAPRARALFWIPSLALGRDGRVLAHIPVGPRSRRLRMFAVATTTANEIGFAEAELSGAPSAYLTPQIPLEIRVGDRVSLPVTVRNRSDRPLQLWLGANLTGGRMEGASDASLRLEPRALRTLYLPISATELGSIALELALRTENETGTLLDARHVTIDVQQPSFEERRVERGSTTGRDETVIELDDPLLQDAAQLQIVLAPSLMVELRDPLQGLLEGETPGREAEISRLRAADALRRNSSAFFEVPSEEQLEQTITEHLELLEAAPNLPDDPQTAAYLDAYALWTLGELAKHGQRVESDLLARIERRLTEWQAHGAESGPTRTELALQAFQTWARIAFGRSEARADEIQLGQLLSRSDELGVVGRLYAALALDAYQRGPQVSSRARTQIDSHLNALIAEMRDWAPEGPVVEIEPNGLPFSSTSDDRIRASALALTFLSIRQPNHPLAARLLPWLLDQRRAGTWPNPHEAALATNAIQLLLARVEKIHYPLQGRVVLGLMRTEAARFTAENPAPRVLTLPLEELSRAARPSDETVRLPIAFETGAFDPLVYQMRLEVERDALRAPAIEEGMSISRRYLDPSTGADRPRWIRGVPVEAQIWIATWGDVPEGRLLLVEDSIPAGSEILEVGLSEGATVLWSEVSEARIRFVVRLPGSGIHSLRYTMLARSPGEFGVPGVSVKTIYASPALARSPGTRVVVE